MHKFHFHKTYFLLFLLLFVTEVVIALFVHDNFIRPYFGDFLVMILIYTFLMSFFKFSKFKTALFVLIFAFAIETAQYFNFVSLLGLQHSKLARVVLGNSFAFEDLVTYVCGFFFILFAEHYFNNKT
jgi:hypothetical protein